MLVIENYIKMGFL